MEIISTAQYMGRLSGPRLSAVLVIYIICTNLSDWSSARRSGPIKSNAAIGDREFPYRQNRSGGNIGLLSSHNNSYVPMARSNIVRLPVNISNFSIIDPDVCPSMVDDVRVAPAHSMPLTALASFPRSGNSWTRSLIQVATGYSTASVHWESEKDRDRVKQFFKAGTEDYRLRKGICTKTHFYAMSHIGIFDNGAILLIRNPYFSVVSNYLRFYGGEHNVSIDTLVDSMEQKNEHWTNVLLPQFRRWRNTALNWITNCRRLLIVYFEDLEQHTAREVTRMVKFLGRPVEPERILCAVEMFRPKTVHRSKMTFDPYTSDMHEVLDGYIADVNRTLIGKGVEPLPTYTAYTPIQPPPGA